jgi:hypothetical protein
MKFLVNFLKPREIKATFLVTVAVLFAMLIAIIYAAHGHFIYLQDDAYIHLAIAKNFAESGTWGINPGEFASASSSPLWIVMLTLGFFIFGRFTLYLPLVIDVVAVVLTMLVAAKLLLAHGVRGRIFATVLGVIALVTPIGPFAFSGMEHAPHILAVIVFLYTVGLYLSPRENRPAECNYSEKILLVVMGVSSFFVAGLRYEGVFVVGIASMLLLFRKQYRAFFIAALSGALPVLSFGFWSLSQGENFVPNTLLIKKKFSASFYENIRYSIGNAYQNIKMPIFQIFAPVLLLGTWLSMRRSQSIWRPEIVALALITCSFIAQALLGRFSWVAMFRYEAYLVFAGFLFLVLALAKDSALKTFSIKPLISWSNLFLLALLVVVSLPFARRIVAWPYAYLNAKNIYEQTVHVSKFLNTAYAGEVVGANDIGLVAYAGKVTLVDFWGLADKNVMNLRINGNYNSTTMSQYARDRKVKVLAVFSSWFGNTIDSRDWIKAGSWTIPHNVTAGDATVTFYGANCAEAKELYRKLQDFKGALPDGVVASDRFDGQAYCDSAIK